MNTPECITDFQNTLFSYYQGVELRKYESYRGLEDCGYFLESNGRRIGGVSAGLRELKILHDLIHLIDAKFSFQIGVAFGLSTVAIAMSNRRNQIVALDNFSEHPGDDGRVQELATRVLEQFENVALFRASSPQDTSECMKKFGDKTKLCFAFIDGFHSEEAASADYFGLSQYIDSDSVIVWHDIDKIGRAYDLCFDTSKHDTKIALKTWGRMSVHFNAGKRPGLETFLRQFT